MAYPPSNLSTQRPPTLTCTHFQHSISVSSPHNPGLLLCKVPVPAVQFTRGPDLLIDPMTVYRATEKLFSVWYKIEREIAEIGVDQLPPVGGGRREGWWLGNGWCHGRKVYHGPWGREGWVIAIYIYYILHINYIYYMIAAYSNTNRCIATGLHLVIYKIDDVLYSTNDCKEIYT